MVLTPMQLTFLLLRNDVQLGMTLPLAILRICPRLSNIALAGQKMPGINFPNIFALCVLREASQLKNVTKSEKSPKGRGGGCRVPDRVRLERRK